MFLHKNSQRRIYFSEAIYFITIVVKDRLPFFAEEIFCDLLVGELKLGKTLKEFNLYGFVIIPDHVHLLIEPGDKYNISEIMRSFKTNCSRNINRIINVLEDAVMSPRLRGVGLNHLNKILPKYRNQFIQKYGSSQSQFPKFQWQKSFYDHYLRNSQDFKNHLEYIWHNPQKHHLINNFENYPHSSYNDKYNDLIDYFEL
jgi:putative transposase